MRWRERGGGGREGGREGGRGGGREGGREGREGGRGEEGIETICDEGRRARDCALERGSDEGVLADESTGHRFETPFDFEFEGLID